MAFGIRQCPRKRKSTFLMLARRRKERDKEAKMKKRGRQD